MPGPRFHLKDPPARSKIVIVGADAFIRPAEPEGSEGRRGTHYECDPRHDDSRVPARAEPLTRVGQATRKL